MTPALLAFYLGLIGLVVGCFLGLVSVRWPADEDVTIGRSHCRACGRTLSWPDLVPVASYLWTRGRCRTCAALIPIRYPLMELAASGVGVWAALAGSTLPEVILTALLGWQLLLITVIGLEHFWLPDRLTLPLLATGVIAASLLDRLTTLDAVIGAAVGYAVFGLLRCSYRGWRGRSGLGNGDPILFAAGGAWVGWADLPIVLLIASLSGLALVLTRRARGARVDPGGQMPFAPFLAAGVWLVWLLPI